MSVTPLNYWAEFAVDIPLGAALILVGLRRGELDLIAVLATALGPGWLALVLWIWAPLVSLARVAMGVHYVSDIVAGAVLGVVIAIIGLQIYEPILMWVSGLINIPLW